MTLRLLGSAALLLGGALHTFLAFDGYGTSELVEVFFLNGIGSAAVAAGIALGTGWLASAAGVGVATMSIFALALSRVGVGVLGFRGRGFDPAPEALLTLLFEASAVALLSLVVYGHRDEIIKTLRTAAARGRN